jgi:hypothetical protein
MALWLHELGLYIYAVLAHWQALATGGFVTAVVSVIEKRRNKSFSWESYATIMAVFVLYSFFAAWQDEHRNTGSVTSDKTVLSAQLGSCQGTVQTTQSSLREKETIADAFQKAFVAMQVPQAQQQANIGSCITNLAKMNPVIREKILAITVPIGTVDVAGHIPIKTTGALSPVVPYRFLTEVFVLTNVIEGNFHGIIHCERAFDFVDTPVVPSSANAMMVAGSSPKSINENSYEVRYDATGYEWNQSHPAYMRLISKDAYVNSCSFTKTE